jgi:hypothetical protein
MKKVWDRVGIAFSSACVLHCLAVAFLPFFFPALKAFTHQTWVHIATALTGLLLVFSGILLERIVTDQISHGVSIVGSLMLVYAHAKNLLHTHRHHHQCC